jgi:uncharacterized RDD family membrane protein YckC
MAAQDLVLLSPEKSVLTFRLATIGSRIMAVLLDLIILMAVLFGITFILAIAMGVAGEGGGEMFAGVMMVIMSLGPFLYFILLEGLWNGQTIGKKALGIRVRMTDGTPITFGAALGRNLLLPADLMPGTGFVGLLAMFTNVKCQRLGDLVANTIVLHERKPEPVFSVAPHVVALHPLESHVGSLQKMTIEEYNALRLLCDRFPELSREMQLRLMSDVWKPFAQRHDLQSFPGVDPVFIAEAVVMRYGRIHGLL